MQRKLVLAVLLSMSAPAYASTVASDTLTLSANGQGLVGNPPSISAFDTSIAGTPVEIPGSFNVILVPVNNPLTGQPLDVFNLTSLPIAFTDPGGNISDIVGVCSPCANSPAGFQGIFFISDPFESQISGPFSATFLETGQPQDVSSLLSSTSIQQGISTTFASDVEAIPLPAALPLFASGLVGLLLLGWRRKKKAIDA